MPLHYLVLELHLCDLRHVHVAAWCDRYTDGLVRPTSSTRRSHGLPLDQYEHWANNAFRQTRRHLSLRCPSPAQRTPWLMFRHGHSESTRRALSSRATTTNFHLTFNSRFPLPQDASWRMFRLPPKLPMLVISELRSSQSRLGSWLRITKKGGAIGSIGESLPRTVAWTHTSGPKRKRSASDYSCGFAEFVRTGGCGKEKRVRATTVQVALRAIGTTCEMDGLPNPLYRCEGRYLRPLERQIESFRRIDPPPQHKLAVPVSVAEHLVQVGRAAKSARDQAVGDLVTIAFYYLLRVGEYTWHSDREARRTKQFRVKDVTFWDADGSVIPNDAPSSR